MNGVNEAVSEVVGSLLVIVIISVTVMILYITSYPVFYESRDSIQHRNAYFKLVDLKDKIDRIKSGVEPNATITLSLADIPISFRNEGTIAINSTTYQISSISYLGGGWELIFENGAIIERRWDKARMLSAPDVYLAANTLNMPVISFIGNISAGGKGMESFTATLENASLLKKGPAEIKISTRNSEAWKEYFDSIGLTYTVSGNEVRVTVPNSYVVLYEIRLR